MNVTRFWSGAAVPGPEVKRNDSYWLAPVSRTFHGRDIFAPVAAHIASGVRPDDAGEPVAEIFPFG